MRKWRYLSVLIVVISIITLSTNASIIISYSDTSKRISKAYHANIQIFDQSINNYLSISLDSSSTQEQITLAHHHCRNQYKKIDYLLQIFEHDFIKKHLNGPPLQRLENKGQENNVSDPEGLQLLDELVYADSLDNSTIALKVNEMLKWFNQIVFYEQKRKFSDDQIIVAMRSKLVQILALGITGFDTPGSLNGLEESKVSLIQMSKDFQQYHNAVTPQTSGIFESIIHQFDGCSAFLDTNTDFDSFDRLEFIKSHLDPLYRDLLEFHKSMQFYMVNDEARQFRSVNYLASGMFDEDFLNPYFYTYLKESEINEAMLALGEMLFYEPRLSGNNAISCASCHPPTNAFNDGLPKSLTNMDSVFGERNTPTLWNAIYADRFFHDMRSDDPMDQIFHVLDNPVEFATSFEEIIEKLNESDEYKELFKRAYPNFSDDAKLIQNRTISNAIISYYLPLKTFNSPFDQYVRGESEHIGVEVKDGFNLFMGKASCGTCHFAPIFSGLIPPDYHENESEIIGVPLDISEQIIDSDIGRIVNKWKIEKVKMLSHSFKTGNIRNIELTGPYMHNGVYEELEDVIEFYNKGGGAGIGYEVPNQTLSSDSLGLTEYDKTSLIAFLESLTDTSYSISIPEYLPAFPDTIDDRKVVYFEENY